MKAIIADDHMIFRQGLRLALEMSGTVTDITEVGTFEQLLQTVTCGASVDIIILDLNMPGLTRSSGIVSLRSRAMGVPILILSASEDVEDVLQSLGAGASGYVPKTAGIEVLDEAIKMVCAGGVYVPRQLLTGTPAMAPAVKSASRRLTQRQSEVLTLAAEGHANKEIAYRLGLSEGTVKSHLATVMRQLAVHNRVQLFRKAEQLGLVQGPGGAGQPAPGLS